MNDLHADRFAMAMEPLRDGGVSTLDVINGTEGDDSLTGTAGADEINGLGGADTIHGGDGDDTITGGGGADLIFGEDGNDVIYQDQAKQHFGGSGTIDGGAGDDTLFGALAGDSMIGGTGDDVIHGGIEASVDGGDGNDTISVEAIGSSVDGGLGDDVITCVAWTSGGVPAQITLHGGEGDDRISLILGGNQLGSAFGDGGDDTLIGGSNNETLDGGSGSDTIDYSDDRSGVSVDLVAQTGTGAAAGHDTLASIENAIGGHHNDVLTGNLEANLLDGGSGDDSLEGGDGADTLLGGGGKDVIQAGLGQDTLTGGGGGDSFVFTDIGQSTNAAPDLITDLGKADIIDLTAIDADTGTAGIQAFHLAAAFSGQAGELVLTYDAGLDATRIQGDVDGDGQADFTILASGDQHGFTRFAPVSDATFDATLKGGAGDDALTGSDLRELIIGVDGDDVLSGLGGNDQLLGGSGDDQLFGGSGEDTLDGGGGVDTVQGGSGDDLILLADAEASADGGSGFDTVSFAQARFGVTARTGGAPTAGVLSEVERVIGSDFADSLTLGGKHEAADGGDGDDRLAGAARSLLEGGDGSDKLIAGLHATLDGGAGDDTLISRQADVRMTGGDGADTFAFAGTPVNGSAPADLITDLQSGDTVDVSRIDADVTTDGDQAFVLVGSFDGHAGQAVLAYDAGADETRLELDTDGDGLGDIAIRMTGDQTEFSNFVL